MVRAVRSYGMPEGHASVPESLLVRWRSETPLVRHLVLSRAEGKFTFERTIQLFAETMSFGLRLRERAIDAIKSKISEIQCWLEARLQEFTVLVRRRQRTCHKTGPSTACVASTKSIWQELREIWPNNVQHPGRSQQCSRCQFDLREYVLDTEPSPAQLSTMVFYS